MTNKILFWIPRVIAILAVAFLTLFSLDCFGSGQSLKNQVYCFLMHNIPSLILIFILIYFWRKDLILGILFIVAAFVLAIRFDGFGKNWGVLIIAAPILLAGILYLINYFLEKRKNTL
jgi:hypothetical protein